MRNVSFFNPIGVDVGLVISAIQLPASFSEIWE